MAQITLNIDLKSGNAEKELSKFKKSIQGIGDPKGLKNVDDLRKSYANLINTIQGTEKNYKKGTFSKIADEAKKYLEEVKQLDPATKEYAESSKKLGDALKRLQADFAEAKINAVNLKGSLKDIVLGFAKFQLAAMAVMKPLQLLRQEFEHMNEVLEKTESSIVKLRRVAGESANATDIYRLAEKYSESFENVAEVIEKFSKSGYDWADSLLAAESALTAMKVAELDAEQASEGLIAIIKQFNLEITDLTDIVDILNKTADEYAVDTEELLIALQKTGSTAKNAGLDIKETTALIAALSEGTAASGQNIGNALRSLFVFTSDDKALNKFAGLSDEMNTVVKDFKAGKVSILAVWEALGKEMGDRKDLKDVFGGVELDADMEANLTQIQDELAEIYGTAGNYRQNYWIALLDNIETAKKAISSMEDATGYSQKELNEELETYENMVQSLNTRWEEMLNNPQGLLGFKKMMVELGDDVLNVVELLQTMSDIEIFGVKVKSGVLPTILANNEDLSEKLQNFYNEWFLAFTLSPVAGITNIGVNLREILNKKKEEKAIEESLQEAGKETEDIKQNIKDIKMDLSKIDDDILDSILDKLREARDATKEAYEYEEKKKAVLDAEKALLDAEKNRRVRVFNSETGLWEWQANQKEIEQAKENLDKAKQEVEDSAYDEVIDAIESKATNAEILAILTKWAGAYGTGSENFVENIKDIIKGQSNINLDDVTTDGIEYAPMIGHIANDLTNFYESQSTKPKTPLEQLFEINAQEQFVDGLNSNGIVSGASEGAAKGTITSNVTTTDSHNNQYILNGNIVSESDASSMTLSNLFSKFMIFTLSSFNIFD